MTYITTSEFTTDPNKFFLLAKKEPIVIQDENLFYNLTFQGVKKYENPSPSNDPFFDDPNVEKEILQSSQQIKDGNFTMTSSKEELLIFLESL